MNVGKQFEADIKKSVPKDVYFQRIKDQSFDHTSEITRFTQKNQFDCMLYKNGLLFLLELKSTKSTSFSVQKDKTEKSKMIKLHQIESLLYASKFGIEAGFMFNFRFGKNFCFYMNIEDFVKVMNNNGKKSINFTEIQMNSKEIKSNKLRVNYRYDINDFILSFIV